MGSSGVAAGGCNGGIAHGDSSTSTGRWIIVGFIVSWLVVNTGIVIGIKAFVVKFKLGILGPKASRVLSFRGGVPLVLH